MEDTDNGKDKKPTCHYCGGAFHFRYDHDKDYHYITMYATQGHVFCSEVCVLAYKARTVQ